MGSTKVEAPPPRDIGKETSDTLQAQIDLAPAQLAAYQQTAPGYMQTDLRLLGEALFGEGYTGNLTDINRRLTDEAAAQSRTANTAQREADLADVRRLSPEVQATIRAANPELFGNLDKLDAAAAATSIEKELQRQAEAELALGSDLSAEEQRLVRAQTRAAADARGRGFSNAALADEALNSASARQARLDSRRGFAAGVNGLLGQQFGRQTAATQARLATFSDPYMGVLGRASSNAGSNAQLFGNAVGTAGATNAQTRSMFDPFNAYSADLYNTNYNAEAAARIATANNKASLTGAGIGALGMATGGFFACWVARAIYGAHDPRWKQFRAWLYGRAPLTLWAAYLTRGPAAAARVQRDPAYRAEMRTLFDRVLALSSSPGLALSSSNGLALPAPR